MTSTTSKLLPLLLLLATAASAPAAVFQFAAPLETRKGEALAFLWIPPQAEQVRGVVMVGMTLAERELAQDQRIRAACADEQLAIAFLQCGLGAVKVQDVLDKLADVSGYGELRAAPLFFFGHSAGGPQARLCAHEMPDRCFGLVTYRGGDVGDVDHAGADAVGPGIPALMMIGQFDEFGKIGRDASGVENWEKDRNKVLAFRQQAARHLVSIAVEPGAGHFAWSDRNAELLAMFIRKAAAARIPAQWNIDAAEPIALREIKSESGWLSDPVIKPPVKLALAAAADYQGDKLSAAWHFDREMAEAIMKYHAGIEREDQFLSWNDPHTVNAGARNIFNSVAWVDDGQTFEVHPAYAKTVPERQPSGLGARWGRAGEPVGHAAAPIAVKHVSGPIRHVSDYKFRIHYSELAPATDNARVVIMAFSEGDDKYRYTERVGMIASTWLTAGKPQAIRFDPLDNLTAKSEPVPLAAKSDAGLPVEFYVALGPAQIVDGKLTLAEIPHRAKFPLTVKIIAWQHGRGVEPLVQTATPVEQVIQVLQ